MAPPSGGTAESQQVQGELTGAKPLHDSFLPRHSGPGCLQDLLEALGPDQDHAIGIAEDNVASPDPDPTGHDRLPDPSRLVLDGAQDGATTGEDGEAQALKRLGVPDPSVDDQPSHAARLRRYGQDLAPVASQMLPGVHDQDGLARRMFQRSVDGQVVAVPALDGQGGPADAGTPPDGTDRRVEGSLSA